MMQVSKLFFETFFETFLGVIFIFLFFLFFIFIFFFLGGGVVFEKKNSIFLGVFFFLIF